MAYVDLVFPETLSRGTSGGPGYSTRLQRADSGFAIAQTSWDDQVSRGRWNLSLEGHTQAEIHEILKWVRCMRGPAVAFRFKDPADWSTRPNHVNEPDENVPSHRHSLAGANDGTNKIFQLEKTYTDDSGRSFTRKITRPIAPRHGSDADLTIYALGTPFWKDGLNLFPNFDISVEYDTGKVRWDPAPPSGANLQWSGTYHVPVTFAPEVDDGPGIEVIEGDNLSVTNLAVVELARDYNEGHEQLFFGGGTHIDAVPPGPTVTLDLKNGFYQRFNQLGGAGTVRTPDPASFTQFVEGGPVMLIENTNGSNLTVVNQFDQLIVTLAAGESAELWYVGAGLSQQRENRFWISR